MKKIVSIILVAATLLNICAGAVIFLDIRIMELPETQLTVELVELNADDATIQIILTTTNPNSFSLFIQHITVQTTSGSSIINHLSLAGGEIPGNKNKTFTSTAHIRFNGTLPEELTSTITGTVGVMFLGVIKKTLPLHMTIKTPFSVLIEQLGLPQISLQGNFSDITQARVKFTETVTVTNPYSFDLAIGNISTDIITDTGVFTGTILIPGEDLPSHTTRRLQGDGVVHLEALNAKSLTMNLNGSITVIVAGIQKTMNLSIQTEIIPPDISSLLSDIPTEASLSGDYKIIRGGLRDHITFNIYNPHNITLLATNVVVFIYRVDDGTQRLLCNGVLPDGIIVPQTKTSIQGDMVIPWSQIRHQKGERIIMDRLAVTIRANITIQGLNQTIRIAITGYQDFGTRRLLSQEP